MSMCTVGRCGRILPRSVCTRSWRTVWRYYVSAFVNVTSTAFFFDPDMSADHRARPTKTLEMVVRKRLPGFELPAIGVLLDSLTRP